MQLARPGLDINREWARTTSHERGLLTELVEYLHHRQSATSIMVEERARFGQSRAVAFERRHDQVLERLDRIERRLGRLDDQVDDLRVVTETLRGPAALPSANGVVANGHVTDVSIAPTTAYTQGKSLLRVEGLAKEIGGTDILRDITFDVYENEILGLIGPNGAGKTTLMECLAGMRPRSGGTFFIGDEAPPSWNPKALLFYLPNNVLPYGELFTIEVLNFFANLYEVDQQRWEKIVVRDLSLGPAL